MKDAPIGVFDSGVGGLTVLRALRAALPCENFIYLGDTARLPYGTKSQETVAQYSVQAARKLQEYGVKYLVIACNTASAAGLSAIRDHVRDMPVTGVIEPGAEAACRASRSGRIAVVATEGTVRGGAYQRAISRLSPDVQTNARAAPLWVALVEEGMTDGPIAEALVRHYLDPLFVSPAGPGPDTLVLGCTHFPMLFPLIRRVLGPEVAIVDSAETTAHAVQRELAASGSLRMAGEGSLRMLATDGPERFARVGGAFLGHALEPGQIELVDLK